MNKLITISVVFLTFIFVSAIGNNDVIETKNNLKNKVYIPSVDIKNLNGDKINSSLIINKDSPTLIVFWATCCAPCKKELSTISKVYKQWQKETAVNIVAVSVDLPQYANGVAPFVKNNNWPFDIYLDVERDLMHKMNAYNTPHSFLINKKGEIIWEKQGFVSGDEEQIFKMIKSLN